LLLLQEAKLIAAIAATINKIFFILIKFLTLLNNLFLLYKIS
jgi:hypothetical protein